MMILLILNLSIISVATSTDSNISNSNVNIENENDKSNTITDQIILMNYITTKIEEVINTRDEILLYETLDNIENNIKPSYLKSTTREKVLKLIDGIYEKLKENIALKRINYIYEQKEANAMNEVLKPNVMSLLTTSIATTVTKDPMTAALTIGSLVVDRVQAYNTAIEESEDKYLKDNWKIEDEILENVKTLKKDLLEYRSKMVEEHNIPDEMVLSPKDVDEYGKNSIESNNSIRLRFFQDNLSVYKGYPQIFLELARCYYENQDYKKCVEYIDKYLNIGVNIFKTDKELAKVYPLGFIAASTYMDNTEYEKYVLTNIDKMNEMVIQYDIDDSLSDVKYKAALIYLNLYRRTNNATLLKDAYERAKSNIVFLIKKQKELNKEYIELSFGEKGEAPVNNYMVLNLEVLYSLMEKLNLGQNEKNNIMQILYNTNKEHLFYNLELDEKYYLGDYTNDFKNLKKFKEFDTYLFGSYLQDEKSEKSPIEWIVLDNDIENNKILLFSRYILCLERYNNIKEDVTWETSSIREWLNEEFYNNAFNKTEQERILISRLYNNYDKGVLLSKTNGGNDTDDKVFLLSEKEIEKYFKKFNEERSGYIIGEGKDYANKMSATRVTKIWLPFTKKVMEGAKPYIESWSFKNDDWDYYLRTPGDNQKKVSSIDYEGHMYKKGWDCTIERIGIRPAIWIKY